MAVSGSEGSDDGLCTDHGLGPVTDVIQLEDALFVDDCLPEPGDVAIAPRIAGLEVFAREDQAFELEVEQAGDAAISELALALDSYAGHLVVPVLRNEWDGEMELDFRVAVTSGQYQLKAVPLAASSTAGRLASADFVVEIRGLSADQATAVFASWIALGKFVEMAFMGTQILAEMLQLCDSDDTEFGGDGCPVFTAEQDGDEVSVLTEWAEGCDQEEGDGTAGTVVGTGTCSDQTINLVFDLEAPDGSQAGTLDTAMIGSDESGTTYDSSVDIDFADGFFSTATAGLWSFAGSPDDLTVEVSDVGGTATLNDDDEQLSMTVRFGGVMFENLEESIVFPSAGTITASITTGDDADSSISVTYTSATPETGVVNLSVDGGPVFEYEIN